MNTQPENGARPDSAEERRSRIARVVQDRGSVRVVDLVGPLGVSEPTLRKDLTILEKQGLLKRTHGGAVALGAASEAVPEVPVQQQSQPGTKDGIARFCLGMIADNSSAFFDSGATIVTMAELMDQPANVLTNSIPVVPHLADKPRIRHTLLGGQYRPLSESVTGPVTMMGLRQFTVDTAFISVVGVTADGGYVTDLAEADIKRAAIDCARRVVIPLESSKVGQLGFCHLVDLGRVDDIVTDAANPELQQWCTDNGVRLHVVR